MCNRIELCNEIETNESDPELFFDEYGDLQELAEWTPQELDALWERAIASFPHELEPTSIEQGTMPEDLECDELGYTTEDLEYSVEYTFTAGMLGDSSLIAGGWVEIRFDVGDNEPSIHGWFGVSLNGDFRDESARVLGKHDMLQSWYDVSLDTWDDLTIESM